MKAEIELHGTGQGTVSLDGVDVSKGVRGGTLYFGAHETPLLVLDVAVVEGAAVEAEVDVILTPHTHDLLVHLGWTPPDPASPLTDADALAPPG